LKNPKTAAEQIISKKNNEKKIRQGNDSPLAGTPNPTIGILSILLYLVKENFLVTLIISISKV